MSAATRRPYLGEDVHYSFLGECLVAKVTKCAANDSVNLWVWFPREPGYINGAFYLAEHTNETWHFTHSALRC